MRRSDFNPKRADELLAEFVRRHEAGEAPDPAAFLSRAGEEGQRLRELIALFLAEAEPVVPSDAAALDLAERFAARPGPAEALLAEFVRRHEAGEAPDPAAFLSRAGEEGQRLRELIALFLAEAEPVVPSDAAALDLAERFEPARTDAADAPAEAGWRRTFAQLFEEWIASTAEARVLVLERLAAGTTTLRLSTESLRSHRGSAGQVVPLDHPPGARVETGGDRCLWLIAYGLPPEAVGSRPLVAFARAGEVGEGGLEWAGRERGLPDGIVEAEEVGERRELRARIGRASEPDQVVAMLAEIWIFTPSAGASD